MKKIVESVKKILKKVRNNAYAKKLNIVIVARKHSTADIVKTLSKMFYFTYNQSFSKGSSSGKYGVSM
ncbi:hypothetical protein GOY07_00955 [Wolbachia endosymbiont of Litomosoides sigmodontis]|uniref:hypothetical protein n=1 Tax=Wolbachia endosymbiont of Litomosoides sigmodontis TaxID=80850 RepID=UPI00158F19BD|nr:hypothetical protein [Wolbachia endosymbiont of Litomosoides sigmodontis]QKX02799.1 hypothetical protein GOY07_00955 [Wolbachia endosymbiont of Litomosoides sigmodontis]